MDNIDYTHRSQTEVDVCILYMYIIVEYIQYTYKCILRYLDMCSHNI